MLPSWFSLTSRLVFGPLILNIKKNLSRWCLRQIFFLLSKHMIMIAFQSGSHYWALEGLREEGFWENQIPCLTPWDSSRRPRSCLHWGLKFVLFFTCSVFPQAVDQRWTNVDVFQSAFHPRIFLNLHRNVRLFFEDNNCDLLENNCMTQCVSQITHTSSNSSQFNLGIAKPFNFFPNVTGPKHS